MPGDTRLVRWKKILNVLQKQPQAIGHNNSSAKDTLRQTLVKVLRALQNA